MAAHPVKGGTPGEEGAAASPVLPRNIPTQCAPGLGRASAMCARRTVPARAGPLILRSCLVSEGQVWVAKASDRACVRGCAMSCDVTVGAWGGMFGRSAVYCVCACDGSVEQAHLGLQRAAPPTATSNNDQGRPAHRSGLTDRAGRGYGAPRAIRHGRGTQHAPRSAALFPRKLVTTGRGLIEQ